MSSSDLSIANRTVYITSDTPPSPSLFGDIQSAYAKLTKSPIALTLLVLGLLSIIAETNNKSGPFEIIKTSLETYVADKKHPVVFTTLATLLLGIIKIIVNHKSTVFLLMLIAVIPLTYKHSSVTFTTFALIIYVFITNHTQFTSLAIIQLVFIYYSINEFLWRIVDIIAIIYLTFGSQNINLMLSKD